MSSESMNTSHDPCIQGSSNCKLGGPTQNFFRTTGGCSSPVFGELQGQKTLVYLVSDALKECLFYVPFEGFARHPLWGLERIVINRANPVK